MTVCIRERDRCRLCFTLVPRDRPALFSSVCCQKSYQLFQQIHRRKLPRKPSSRFPTKLSNRTVCLHDLIRRYLRTELNSTGDCSNVVCANCSMILLDVEQCAKYLRKTINQLKIKFNRSNRLFTSSLAVKFQKKESTVAASKMKNEQLPILNSDDDDEEFEDIEDDEESDDEHEDLQASASSHRSKGLRIASPSSSNGDSVLNIPAISSSKTTPCNDADEEDDDDLDDDDEEDDGEHHNHASAGRHSSSTASSLLTNTAFDPALNALDESNPALLQLRFVHMMANLAAASNAPGGNHGTNPETMMAALANMQRNAFMKMISDPSAAAQMAAAAASASAAQLKANLPPTSSNNNQAGSVRKRKSTPGKRVIAHHWIEANNGHTSPNDEHQSRKNSLDSTDRPSEVQRKDHQRSSRILSPNDVQNFVINHKGENGSPTRVGQSHPRQLQLDEDLKESATPNESSLSLSPSLIRRPAATKRPRLSASGHFEYPLTQNQLHTGNASQTTAHLLSPNDDPNAANHPRQQRKLDPRPCTECGKVLFSDKTHLLHCQTHARNEKQCWICGVTDDEIKKHIVNEHGNQKFTNAGFKCQHCDKTFPVFTDLEGHTKEHSKKKPFECPICHKRFGQQGNLSCHLRIHSGVKPFNCNSCGKAFRHSNSLRRHARTVHSAARGLSSSSNSFLPDTTMPFADDYKNEPFDDEPSAPMIASDDSSSSTGGVPSPSVSNIPLDSDSPEPLETN